MKNGLVIAQLTDCHLSRDPRQAYRGIDPYHGLHGTLQKINRLEPDLLLATGDLSEDGSPASYRALQAALRPVGAAVLALPGNHDDPQRLAEAFPGSPTDGIAVTQHGAWQLIRLNSCLPGVPQGRLDEAALQALQDTLGRDPGRPRLVAVHHQPLPVGSPWIDKHRLLEPERFLQIIDRCRDVRAVVWGHVHQAFAADRNGTALLGGPSSAINSLPGADSFTPDPGGPGCRWLELLPDGRFRTGFI